MRLGALLHDVGKIAIPDAILTSPARSTRRVGVHAQPHAHRPARSSRARPALRDVAALVRASHEHFDGSGYPDGLRGEDIPAGARIIAVCDAFDAMTRTAPTAAASRPRPRSRSCAAARARSSTPAVVQAFAEAHEAHASLHAGPLAA